MGLFALFVFFAAPAAANAALIQKSPTINGLVGWWTLDSADVTDKVYDRSGKGNSGYFVGGATTSAKIDGKVSQALFFNGTSQYVMVAHQASLSATPGVTVSAWVNPRTLQSGASPVNTVVAKDGTFSGTLDNYQVDLRLNGEIEFAYRGSDGTGNEYRTSAPAITTNNWQHVVVTFDGVTNPVIYVNGIAQAAAYVSGGIKTLGTNTQPLYIGAITGNSHFFDGKIDDVRIYNRALSWAEVTQLYNSQQSVYKPKSPPIVGLVGWWTLDGQDVTDKVYDRSGQGNSGYFAGMATSSAKTLGKLGQAALFNGAGNINVADSNSLDLGNTFSISLWFKPNNLSQSSTYLLSKLNNANTDNPYAILWEYTDNQVEFYCGSGCGVGYPAANTRMQASDTNWHMITYTYDGATFRGYLDGVTAITPVSVAQAFTATTGNLLMATFNGAIHNFAGAIDDVRLYNRALSAAEVATLYNSTQSVQKSNVTQNSLLTSGLVGLWSFNGPDMFGVTTAIDRSGQGNHGTLINGPLKSAGRFGQSIRLRGAGVNDYASIPNLTIPTTAGSLSLWWRPQSATNVVNPLFTSRLNGTTAFDLYPYSDSKLYAGWLNGSDKRVAWPMSGISVGTWYHVVLTWTNGGNTNLYINNALKGSTAGLNATWDTSAVTSYIGADGVVLTNSAKSDIDEVRLYNRALSAAEVKRLYNLGR